MKKIIFTSLTALAPILTTGCVQQTPKEETQPSNAVKTPPARNAGSYEEPPMEPKTKNPTTQPSKKKSPH